jgi:hypothetical protein
MATDNPLADRYLVRLEYREEPGCLAGLMIA